MAFNTEETGANVSAPSTGAALVISLDGILKSAAKTTPDKILAMMVKLLNQAEQLRLLQRAILRRNHRIKELRAEQSVFSVLRSYIRAYLDAGETPGIQGELLPYIENLLDLYKKETPNV